MKKHTDAIRVEHKKAEGGAACEHVSTRAWEPHLAGARKCNGCGMVFNPNRQPNWQRECEGRCAECGRPAHP